MLTAVLSLFAELKARREELWLEEAFAAYADYREQTRHKFIPFLW